MDQPATVRHLDSAPSARAERRKTEAAFADLTAYFTEQLRQHHHAKVPYSDAEELKRLRRAAHAASKHLGCRIATRATKDGALVAAINEDASPLQSQVDDNRLRRTMDQTYGPLLDT